MVLSALEGPGRGSPRLRAARSLALPLALAASLLATGAAVASPPPTTPDFGPNVIVLDPSMPTSQIQATVDAIAAAQDPDQFGNGRYEILFKPGEYGADTPLNFQVGYYTDVAGLGALPTDVTVDGSIDVYNQCFPGDCNALDNFWRSLANLTVNVESTGCQYGEFWVTSQATSMRRVDVPTYTSLMDYCSAPSFDASGGFIADSALGSVTSGSQQQYLVRNSSLGSWSNGVWNQVFAGVTGAPAQCFPAGACGGPYTTLAANPESREKPFLYVDGSGNYNVYVPDAQFNSTGPTWTHGQTPGHSLPIGSFFIARPTDSAAKINAELARGKNLILTPGIYNIDRTIKVMRPNTIVLGMGLATLEAQHGVVPMYVGDVQGVEISDVIFDAGPVNSPTLLEVGNPLASLLPAGPHSASYAANPTVLSDVYFRIGGAHVGRATVALDVNSNNVILDNIWSWRADHGTGVGWTSNTASTGLLVTGNNVTATGLFVEHYQKDEVLWTGQHGKIVFFQNEMPYDPPSQAAWTQPDGTLGYPAIHVTDNVKTFQAWGIGSYSYFNQGVDIYSANAFVVPTHLAAGSVQDALTIFLSTAGFGGIQNVIDGTGGSSTIANPDVVVPVVSYP